jgi:integrase/recombinase XerD
MPASDAGRPALYNVFVPSYLDFVRRHRGRRTTHQLERCLVLFFDWLAERGIGDLKSLSAHHARDFVGSLGRFRPTTIAVHASALRGFLRYLHLSGVLESDLAYAVERPRLYRRSEPPQVLDPDSVERLLRAVDRSTGLGKRDYAILLLAARYGLRPSDIGSLRFENVRWREQQIVLLQSKTQRALELPLLADVDEALVDYIRSGRPVCTSRQIFIRHVAPIGPLAPRNNLWPVMDRAARAAGFDLPRPRRGLQLLRHSLATHMLGNGVALHTISDILGHSSTEATLTYTQVDLAGLRSVALSEAEVCR